MKNKLHAQGYLRLSTIIKYSKRMHFCHALNCYKIEDV